eukprot:1160233-Pelagomonas_calceolata.AAC.2
MYEIPNLRVQWDLIGEVSGPPSGGGGEAGAIKKLHRGKEYDYVIDVDVAVGDRNFRLSLMPGMVATLVPCNN